MQYLLLNHLDLEACSYLLSQLAIIATISLLSWHNGTFPFLQVSNNLVENSGSNFELNSNSNLLRLLLTVNSEFSFSVSGFLVSEKKKSKDTNKIVCLSKNCQQKLCDYFHKKLLSNDK